MFFPTFAVTVIASLAATTQAYSVLERAPVSSLHKRLTGQTVAFACYGGGGDCECPTDNDGNPGVLINVFPGFQCAYPTGACTWDDQTGALSNGDQGNCPSSAACSKTSGCQCPTDTTGAPGILINQFTGFQCAYDNGACTWASDGNVVAPAQSNCPSFAKCTQSGVPL
ncbi:hypothetical protein PsYK624_162450 [Phanerochaete sordida]|uniref:Uncharacterized protein n=1 Tax=Phanerochaete sordida TaxID=48140 RepID=A0A9P3GRX6_9APHY|nr:hypothetical protein PsYK624_162450 [Phanerochaete sordida]